MRDAGRAAPIPRPFAALNLSRAGKRPTGLRKWSGESARRITCAMSDMPSARASTVGMITIIFTLLSWASVPLFVEHFSHSIDLWTSNGWRYGFSAFLWAPALIVGAYRRRLPPGLFKAALVPAAVNCFGQVAFTWGHYKIEPGLLTFGLRSQMVFVAVGAYLLFPVERAIIRSWQYLIGLVLLMCGTAGALLLGEDKIETAHAWGIILAVTAGMFFAFYGLAVRRFMEGINSVVAFACISQYTALVMVVLMLARGEDCGLAAPRLPLVQLGLLLLSSVVGIALGHVLYYVSIARLGVAVSAGVLQLHPFFVAVGSFFIFGETLTLWQWGAGLVAMGGATMMLIVQRKAGVGRVSGTMKSAGCADERGS